MGCGFPYLKIFLIQICQIFQKNPCFIEYFCYSTIMKFALFSLSVWVFALIASPIVALFMALVTFFSSFFGFFRGISVGLDRIKSKETEPNKADVVDIWDKHINRMKNKQNNN